MFGANLDEIESVVYTLEVRLAQKLYFYVNDTFLGEGLHKTS